jgi:hypothetical protein
MAGFFGLFKSKTKYVDEPEPASTSQAEATENTEAFFLKPDDAKTLGNIDFMRQPKRIRRTFPKTRSNQSTELVQDISSIDKASNSGSRGTIADFKATSQPQQPAPTTTESPKRRRSDSSMDMFRNMARELKKK